MKRGRTAFEIGGSRDNSEHALRLNILVIHSRAVARARSQPSRAIAPLPAEVPDDPRITAPTDDEPDRLDRLITESEEPVGHRRLE